MATGIVSADLASDKRHALSLVLLALAAVVWLALGSLLLTRMAEDWPGVLRHARVPAALTGVAATAVLGARATGLGWGSVAVALLVLAAVLWLILLPLVLSRPPAKAAGVAFMATVSTQSLAVLAAQVALRSRAPWLLYPALGLLALGLLLYVVVLATFDLRQLLVGRGDHWVSGGALAISALAAARLTLGFGGLHELPGALAALRAVTLALWVLSAAWLPALIVAELARPRWGYDVRRWATVFPVGMYAACSFDAGRAVRVSGLTEFAQVWVWFALALWVLVFLAAVWRAAAAG